MLKDIFMLSFFECGSFLFIQFLYEKYIQLRSIRNLCNFSKVRQLLIFSNDFIYNETRSYWKIKIQYL